MNTYPIITTPAIVDCVAFYRKAFDVRVLFESPWYVHLKFGTHEIGFLRPDPPEELPVFRHARPTSGLCLAVEVPDVQAHYDQLVARGIETLGQPTRGSGGEPTFSVLDPSGTVLNFVEVHAASPDFIEL